MKMRFPGEDYKLIVQTEKGEGFRRGYKLGYREFWVDHGMYHPKADNVTIYKPIYAEGKVTKTVPGFDSDDLPLLILGTFTLPGLEQLIDSGHTEIFVYCWWDNPRSVTVQWSKRYAEPIRWLYEYSHKVDFIFFGTFDYEIFYMSGGAGSVCKKNQSTWHINEDGKPRKKNLSEISKFLVEKYPGRSVNEYNLVCYKEAAIFAKNFYERPRPREFFSRYTGRDLNAGVPFETTRTDKLVPSSSVNNPLKHRMLYQDGIFCSSCSLNYCCRLYRPLGVCTMPGTRGSDLVSKFGSKDSNVILDALGDLTMRQAAIVEEAYDDHEKKVKSGVQPTIEDIAKLNKLTSDLFKNGVTLAKLRNPNLTKARIEISTKKDGPEYIEGSVVPNAIEQMGDREKSDLIRKMVEAGYDRENIDEETMLRFIGKDEQPQLVGVQNAGKPVEDYF